MIPPAAIERIIELDALARQDAKKYLKKRFIFRSIQQLAKAKTYIGIAGLRGTGKTILLRQLLLSLPSSFYVSMDTLEAGIGLFGLAKELRQNYKVKNLLIDEIHSHQGWQAEVKKIYDFLDIKLIFTSSSSIDIIQSRQDLSRRVLVVHLQPFSFREYIYFKKGALLEKYPLERIISDYKELYPKVYSYEPDFMEFCVRGALPACLDAPYPEVLRNIVEKILSRDLLTVAKLDSADIAGIKNILRFISRSSVEVCSYSSVSKNTGTTKYNAQHYLRLLEQAFVARIVPPYGTNVTKEPKILYSLPFRAHFAEGVEPERLTGALREEFLVHHLSGIEAEVNYLKSMRGEKTADYLVFYKGKKFVFEVGGAGKKFSQLKGAPAARKFILSQPGKTSEGIPLILFGFLW